MDKIDTLVSGLRHLLEMGLQPWSYRLADTHLAEGFFRNLRRFLGRLPGFLSPITLTAPWGRFTRC